MSRGSSGSACDARTSLAASPRTRLAMTSPMWAGPPGVVTLEDTPRGGTRVRWRSTYERAGLLTALLLRLAVRSVGGRLAKAAAG